MGLVEFAELLGRHGASRETPVADRAQELQAACFQLDRGRVADLVGANPELLHEAAPLLRAATFDRADVASLLLDAGMSPNVQDRDKTRPLHMAAYSGAPAVAALLLQHGADVDPIDDVHGTTPIYWAFFGRRSDLVDLLAGVSRDVWTLVMAGKVERLRAVLTTQPRLATVSSDRWGTPLFMLPDDEDHAAEIVRLFLSHGADAGLRRADGATAADIARARGLDDAADLLAVATRPA
jgi:ankyrin repeat protein